MYFIWYIIIGIIAGFVAGKLMRGGGFGLFINLLVGIVGGVLGGWVFSLFGIAATGIIGSLVTSIVGAIFCCGLFLCSRGLIFPELVVKRNRPDDTLVGDGS